MNKLNRKLVLKHFRIAFLIIISSGYLTANAQDRVPYDQGTKYILANVAVTGKVNFNHQTVVTFAGLEKGQFITVPGEQISSAVKKLGKLGLFSDIDFYTTKIEGDSIYLELKINELPKLKNVKFTGIKKNKIETFTKDNDLVKGKVVNDNLITTTQNYIENKYKKDGFYKTKVIINQIPDTTTTNEVNLLIKIDKGDKVKIAKINFEGNEKFSDKKLRGAMSNTKQINRFRILKGSKYIKDKFKEDLVAIVEQYKEKGFRDARIVTDSVYLNEQKNKLAVNIKVEEGNKYYFGNIKFIGNTIYSDDLLKRYVGINKGDTYNGVLLAKRIADKSKPDGDDITNLYQNNGYLFSSINPVETKTANDTIDFEIRVTEGPIAYFNKITVKGNDKTNDEVIYRELRTKPGQKYSKDELVRTIREIGQLGFFDAEAIKPNFKNVDSNAGTVDIEYELVERGASQIELQGGYGGSGFIGTLGLSFNNFSAKNLFKGEAYKPLPMGDGQKVSLRLQVSAFFQTFSVSFQEPWFGGKKPVSFSTSISQSKQFAFVGGATADKSRSFNITSLSVGLAKRLTVPDDYFVLSHSLALQYYDLVNYNIGLFTFGDGSSRNLSYTIGLSRNNKGVNPIFPTYGSEFSLTGKFSPPYSLFNKIDVAELSSRAENKLRNNSTAANINTLPTLQTTGPNAGQYISVPILPGDYYTTQTNQYGTGLVSVQDKYLLATTDVSKVDQEQFRWLEYYKVKFKADWYTKLYDKLVLRTLGEFGFMDKYSATRDLVPFERFFLGGDGLANFAMDGREIVGLRGYPNQSLSSQNGGTMYNKYSMELRYPITLKPSASIYMLSFLEGGASYNSFNDYNPFQLYRSAGVGLRIFMPAFGLLGIDFGYGFDALPSDNGKPHGWETHFIIGQQF